MVLLLLLLLLLLCSESGFFFGALLCLCLVLGDIMNPASGSYHARRASQGRTDPHGRSRTSYEVGSAGGPGSRLIRRTGEIRVAMVPLDRQGIVQPPDAGLISWSNAKGATMRRRERSYRHEAIFCEAQRGMVCMRLGGRGRGIITHMHGTTIMNVS